MPDLFNYGVQGLFVGSSLPYSYAFESIAATPLQGIQSSAVNISYPREDMLDWAGGGEPTLVQRPRANLEFIYAFTSGLNERSLGFVSSATIPALSNLNTERNFYVLTDLAHQDLVSYLGTGNAVLAFGNGLMKSYAFNAAVGQFSTVSVGVEALNLLIQAGSSGQVIPSVYKQSGIYPTGKYVLPQFSQTVGNYLEVAPQNIAITFDSGCAIGTALSGANSCPVQSFGFTIDLPRQETKHLGWAYPNTRAITWPVVINMRADAILNGYQADAINRLGCPDSGWNFTVGFKDNCNPNDTFAFNFRGAKLDSQSFNGQIGGSNRVSFNWSLKIYDLNRTDTNFFMNIYQNCYNSVAFTGVDYGTGLNQTPLTFTMTGCCYLAVLSGPAVVVGNVVTVLNEPATTILRVTESGSLRSEDITVTVT